MGEYPRDLCVWPLGDRDLLDYRTRELSYWRTFWPAAADGAADQTAARFSLLLAGCADHAVWFATRCEPVGPGYGTAAERREYPRMATAVLSQSHGCVHSDVRGGALSGDGNVAVELLDRGDGAVAVLDIRSVRASALHDDFYSFLPARHGQDPDALGACLRRIQGQVFVKFCHYDVGGFQPDQVSALGNAN